MLVGPSGAEGLRDSVARWAPDLGAQARVTTSLARAGAEYLLSVEVRAFARDSLLYGEQVGARDAQELTDAMLRLSTDARRVLVRVARHARPAHRRDRRGR